MACGSQVQEVRPGFFLWKPRFDTIENDLRRPQGQPRDYMQKTVIVGVLGVALSFAMLAVGYLAGDGRLIAATRPQMASVAAGSLDRAAVEGIVRDYLLENPEIMYEVQAALEAKQAEQQKVAQGAVLADEHDRIYNAAYDGIIGNPQGKVSVVEFFDYNCGYCKRALQDMDQLVKSNPDLRFVMKEFPILGPDSQKASQVSMAFRTLAPEKYGEFHRQLLGGVGRAGEAGAIKIALSLGVDEAALRKEMKNPAIGAALSETYELANKLSITGTPSYVIGDEVVFGAMGHEVLTEKLSMATN
jgi:protein-disulfide isomerase